MKIQATLLAVVAGLTTFAAETPLQPLLAVPDQVVYREDFAKAGPINKAHWGPRQGTRWEIANGVLRGQQSSPEFQAKKKDHFGYEPRVSALLTPPQFVAEFSIRFTGGSPTPIAPFIEFGHHVCRLRFSAEGTEMLADHESVRVAEAKDFRYEPGKWYRALAELKGDEFVIQFAGGPTLYAKHPSFSNSASSGADGFGLAGPKGGFAEVDNVTFWTIKADPQPGWAAARAKLPVFNPVPAKAAAPAKKAAKK